MSDLTIVIFLNENSDEGLVRRTLDRLTRERTVHVTWLNEQSVSGEIRFPAIRELFTVEFDLVLGDTRRLVLSAEVEAIAATAERGSVALLSVVCAFVESGVAQAVAGWTDWVVDLLEVHDSPKLRDGLPDWIGLIALIRESRQDLHAWAAQFGASYRETGGGRIVLTDDSLIPRHADRIMAANRAWGDVMRRQRSRVQSEM